MSAINHDGSVSGTIKNHVGEMTAPLKLRVMVKTVWNRHPKPVSASKEILQR